MRYILNFLFLSSLFLFSCQNKNVTPALQTKMDEVMAVHDEVMPKMGEMHKLKKKLKKELKNHLEDVSETRSSILTMIANLEDADEGMMTWMAEYKKPSKLDESVNPMDYYESEQIRIDKVKADMLNSIEAAKSFLNQAGDE